MTDLRNHANLIWGIAELLRGDYRQSQYGDVILPLVVMRRLDQVLEPTRDTVISKAAELAGAGKSPPQAQGWPFSNSRRGLRSCHWSHRQSPDSRPQIVALQPVNARVTVVKS